MRHCRNPIESANNQIQKKQQIRTCIYIGYTHIIHLCVYWCGCGLDIPTVYTYVHTMKNEDEEDEKELYYCILVYCMKKIGKEWSSTHRLCAYTEGHDETNGIDATYIHSTGRHESFGCACRSNSNSNRNATQANIYKTESFMCLWYSCELPLHVICRVYLYQSKIHFYIYAIRFTICSMYMWGMRIAQKEKSNANEIERETHSIQIVRVQSLLFVCNIHFTSNIHLHSVSVSTYTKNVLEYKLTTVYTLSMYIIIKTTIVASVSRIRSRLSSVDMRCRTDRRKRWCESLLLFMCAFNVYASVNVYMCK